MSNLLLVTDFMSILGDKLMISRVEVDQPYFKLAIDGERRFFYLWLCLKKRGRRKQTKRSKVKRGSGGQKIRPVQIKVLTVKKGRVDFEDKKSMARPVALKFEGT